jgi:phosphatidylglycerophosphate synthase
VWVVLKYVSYAFVAAIAVVLREQGGSAEAEASITVGPGSKKHSSTVMLFVFLLVYLYNLLFSQLHCDVERNQGRQLCIQCDRQRYCHITGFAFIYVVSLFL